MIARKSVNKKIRPKSLSDRNVAKYAEKVFCKIQKNGRNSSLAVKITYLTHKLSYSNTKRRSL